MKTHVYTLKDTFNDVTISRHHTALAAVKAQRAHLRALKARNGQNAYLTYETTRSDGADISEELLEARMAADCN